MIPAQRLRPLPEEWEAAEDRFRAFVEDTADLAARHDPAPAAPRRVDWRALAVALLVGLSTALLLAGILGPVALLWPAVGAGLAVLVAAVGAVWVRRGEPA